MKKATIVWEVQKAVFAFDSLESLQDWVAEDSEIGFSFYLGNADDSENIFGEVEDEEIVNTVLDSEQYNFVVEDNTVTVTASVSFIVNVLDNITVEDFEVWVDNGSGWSCGDVYLGDGAELSSWEDGDISLVF